MVWFGEGAAMWECYELLEEVASLLVVADLETSGRGLYVLLVLSNIP